MMIKPNSVRGEGGQNTSVLRRRSKALKIPRIKDLPEGKRAVEPTTLDAFKAFKESTKKQDQRLKEQDLKTNQHFDEIISRMDVIDKRYKEQDRRFENLEHPFQRRDETSVEMKEDLRSNFKTGDLPDPAWSAGASRSAGAAKHPSDKNRRLVRHRTLSRDGVFHPRWQL